MAEGGIVTASTTPLIHRHRALGARLVDFAGWEMPVQYSGIVEEHNAVRERAGLFDVSHMGELWISGSGAGDALAYALVSDPRELADGRAGYSMVCAPDGGIIDDLIVYRLASDRFLLVANAGNVATVASELAGRITGFDATLDDASPRTGLVALQGPRSHDILGSLTDADLASLRYYSMTEGTVDGLPGRVARTGYTGEDGFEIFVAWDDTPALWDVLMREGEPHGLAPCGLGARDTLRLEAGMPLYGNELGLDTDPYEAGLGRVVRLGKDFVGHDALAVAAEATPAKRLVGLRMRERGIPRHGYPIWTASSAEGPAPGVVTSGTMSPTLGEAIGMGYVPPDASDPGTPIEVGIRGKRITAEVVELPFYVKEEAHV